MIVREGLTMAALGIAIGVAAALFMTRLMDGILFGVNARDPLTFTAVTAVVLGVTLLAAFLPARRAARVQPVVALRGTE
jgi:putative ABC transport system permease protein